MGRKVAFGSATQIPPKPEAAKCRESEGPKSNERPCSRFPSVPSFAVSIAPRPIILRLWRGLCRTQVSGRGRTESVWGRRAGGGGAAKVPTPEALVEEIQGRLQGHIPERLHGDIGVRFGPNIEAQLRSLLENGVCVNFGHVAACEAAFGFRVSQSLRDKTLQAAKALVQLDIIEVFNGTDDRSP